MSNVDPRNPRTWARNVEFRFARPFEQALKSQRSDRSRILADLTAFETSWIGDASMDELSARFRFKPVGSDQRCRDEGCVAEIRLVSQKYRALLVYLQPLNQCQWLDTYPKSPERQARAIRVACDRALGLQREAQIEGDHRNV